VGSDLDNCRGCGLGQLIAAVFPARRRSGSTILGSRCAGLTGHCDRIFILVGIPRCSRRRIKNFPCVPSPGADCAARELGHGLLAAVLPHRVIRGCDGCCATCKPQFHCVWMVTGIAFGGLLLIYIFH